MAMVNVDTIAAYLGKPAAQGSKGRGLHGAVLHSLNELCELLQWL